MFLYSYHIIDSNGVEITTEAYSKISREEKSSLRTQVKRYISPNKSIRVLSLVGGGIRGYLLGKTLEEIEKSTGKKIAQLFDCIVGTSTGVPIAFALSYPQEVTVTEIINNPELSQPHLASPKFEASTVTKIYSHYGAYIFANPALKRVLDPFVKGKSDGKTYRSAKEIDEQIEHEGAVINIIAPNFQAAPNITSAIKELTDKINLTKSLLSNISTGGSLNKEVVLSLAQHANFLKTFLTYPLHTKIHNKCMNALKEYLDNPVLLATASTSLTSSLDDVLEPLDFRKNLIPEEDIKTFAEECITELKKYYLEPFNGIKDSIADYEKFSATFFCKDSIEEVLKRFLPIDSKLEDLLGCTAGIACVRDTLELRIIDNCNPSTKKTSSYDAILASTSAQVYFASHTINNEELIDAGSAIKSPSQVAFVLSKKYFPSDRQIEIFEIGTAKSPSFTIKHPQKLTRILNPSDSLYMVMDAGRNSTSAILNLLANDKQNSLLQYNTIDFDLGDEVFLEKTTQEYFNKMSEVNRNLVQNDPTFASYIKDLNSSLSNSHPIIPNGLNFINIPDDGHCLYSAISLYLNENVNYLRELAANYLAEHIEEYQDFFKDETEDPNEYIEKLRNTNEWGGELEIVILSIILNRPIIVMGTTGKIRNKPIIPEFYALDENISPIFIMYNGINHYSGLILKEGYNARTILDNLFKNQINEQEGRTENFLSTSYQLFIKKHKEISAKYDEHNLLQTRPSRVLNYALRNNTPNKLRTATRFLEAYKKYSKTLYPPAPKPCWPLINEYNLPAATPSEGIEVPILSIDGGGTRGIWPLKVLEYIEKSTEKSISHIFPIKGGTSVGGLISIILSIPGKDGQPFYKAKDVANLLKDAEQIFPLGHYKKIRNLMNPEKGVMFDTSGLRTVLKKLIKQATGKDDLKMKDLIGTNIGVLSFDNKNLQPIFFSKTSHPEQSVVEAGVCTASAPVYFPDNSLEINGQNYQMGDGGIPDNNPVWYVYSMFNAAKNQGESAKILSLGTGFYPDAHPKRDEAPFWLLPAALLGYGMDSRTISQNTLMDMYSKTPNSNISNFVRLQWTLPTSIDLTSSLPVTIPFESIPECLPIGYSGDNKIVDYNDLATIMAAKRMVEQDFTNFMRTLIVVENNYSPFDHLNFMLKEQDNKFKQTWAVRLADSIDIKIILLDFIDPIIKQDVFKLIYRTCIGLSIICEPELKNKGIDPELFFKSVDYVALTANITKEAARIGLDKKSEIAAYVHKINIILNFLDEKRKEGILKFISNEATKIHNNGCYSEEPEVFLSYLIINIIKFIYNQPELHEWIDYAEKQLYNPNFLHKSAALTQMLPKSLAEPLVYSSGAFGLSFLKTTGCFINSAAATYRYLKETEANYNLHYVTCRRSNSGRRNVFDLAHNTCVVFGLARYAFNRYYNYYSHETLPSANTAEIKQLALEKDNKAITMFISATQDMFAITSNNAVFNKTLARTNKFSINTLITGTKSLLLLPFNLISSGVELGKSLLNSIKLCVKLGKGLLDVVVTSKKNCNDNATSIIMKNQNYSSKEHDRRQQMHDIQKTTTTALRDFKDLILLTGENNREQENDYLPTRECTIVNNYPIIPAPCVFRRYI